MGELPQDQHDKQRRAREARAKVEAEQARNRRWVSDKTKVVGMSAIAATLAFAGGAAFAGGGSGSGTDQASAAPTGGEDAASTQQPAPERGLTIGYDDGEITYQGSYGGSWRPGGDDDHDEGSHGERGDDHGEHGDDEGTWSSAAGDVISGLVGGGGDGGGGDSHTTSGGS